MFQVTTAFRSGNGAPPPQSGAASRRIAAALLVASLALNGFTFHSASRIESVNTRPEITFIVDPAELKMRQHDVVGTFATGGQPGDRVIAISPDGQVAFSDLGSRGGRSSQRDSYRLGRRAGKLCLTTTDSGLIDVLNIDTLVYYRDTYRRTR